MIIEITAMMFRVDDSILFFWLYGNDKNDHSDETNYEVCDDDFIRNSHSVYSVLNNDTLDMIKNVAIAAPVRKIVGGISVFPCGRKKLTIVEAKSILERSAK